MAVTFAITGQVGPFSVGGNSKLITGALNLSGTYETGGLAVSAGQFGFSTLQQLIVQPSLGYSGTYVPATGKVILAIADVQVTAAVDVSAVDVNFVAIGW